MATDLRNERAALTREAVVDAALARADAEGLAALTFRRLGRDLGVTPMALYRYVASKDELLAAIYERAYAEFELPDHDGRPWQEQLRGLALSYRRVLIAHPALAECERLGIGMPSESGLRIIDVLLGALCQAGFSLEDAANLHDMLARFVVALVVFEADSGPPRAPEEVEHREQEVRARLSTLPADRYANVRGAVDYLCRATDPAATLDLALDLLIAGLQVLLARR